MRNPETLAQAPTFGERHFSPDEISTLWGLSRDTICRLFEHEPGVLVIENVNGLSRKRRYRTLRIPESVLARVHRRLINPPRN